MRSPFFALPLLLAAVTAQPGRLHAADVAMLNLVMPDAKMVSGVDVDRTRHSPFGQYFMQQMAGKDSALDKFTQMAGFDPRKDILEIVVASSSDSGAALRAGTGSVIVLRGAFDTAKLLQMAGAHGAAVTSYNGAQVVESGGKGKETTWVGFLGNLLVAGPQAGVKSAIDRHRSSAKATATMASRAQAASSKHDAWVLTTVSPGAFAGGLTSNPNVKGAMGGELVQGIESITAGVKFGANVIVSGEALTRSDKDASALVDVLKFFASMAQSNGAKSGPLSLLEAVQMNAEGRSVKFSLTTPEQEFEKLFAPGMNRVKARAGVALD